METFTGKSLPEGGRFIALQVLFMVLEAALCNGISY